MEDPLISSHASSDMGALLLLGVPLGDSGTQMEPLVSPPSTAQTLLVALAAKLRTRGCGIRAQA